MDVKISCCHRLPLLSIIHWYYCDYYCYYDCYYFFPQYVFFLFSFILFLSLFPFFYFIIFPIVILNISILISILRFSLGDFLYEQNMV